MEKEQEDKLTQILANSHLNNIKFKDVVELVKFHCVSSVQKDLEKLDEKEKQNLLENVEKQIEEAKAKAEQEAFEQKVEQAEAILGPGQRVELNKNQQKSDEEGQKEVAAESS